MAKGLRKISSVTILISFFLISCFIHIPATRASAPGEVVRLPLATNPAVVVLSGSKEFEIELKQGMKLDGASLVSEEGKEKISLIIVGDETGEDGKYKAVIGDKPDADMVRPGLYSISIKLKTGEGMMDVVQPKCVWILDTAPEELTFAFLSDTHEGDPRAGLSPSKETPDERRRKVFAAANASGAQFIVFTGDVVSVPGDYKNEYPAACDEILKMFGIPLLFAPGNHDLYNTSPKSPKTDGLTFWRAYFGPEYYSTRIGKFTFVSLDTYDWPAKFRNFMDSNLLKKVGSYTEGAMSRAQFAWLKSTLETESKAGQTIVVLGHHRPTENFANVDDKVVPGLAKPEEILSLLSENHVRYFLAGHIHANTETVAGGVKFITVASASAQIPAGESWGYKLCRLSREALKCEFVPVVKQE